MNWIKLQHADQLAQIKDQSAQKPQAIFKHSTRCSISSMVKHRLERTAPPETVDFYYLDLMANRALSNLIAEHFLIPHESPQILLIKNGQCIYHESHGAITMSSIEHMVTDKVS